MNDEHVGSSPGRIEENAAGVGVPSLGEIEERAAQIAVISGRSASHVTEADRDRARRELLGEEEMESHEDEIVAGSGMLAEAPGSTGRQAPTVLPDDEAAVGERLVQEGMDEALHDEMLEAHKKNIDAAS